MDYQTITEQNIFTCHIMSSDEDASVVEDLGVGFNTDHELVVSIEHFDYDDSRYNCSTCAVVTFDDAYDLSRRLNVPLHKLPMAIYDSMRYWRKKVNPSRSQVRACFKEITECLLDERCPFRIRRTYGLRGYRCC